MKKMMILVSAIMMAATANAKRVEMTSFDEVRVNVPARVRIVAGTEYSVSIAASDSIVANAVKANVENGVLSLSTRDIEALGENASDICITIVTPKEPTISTSSDMQMNVRNGFNAKYDMTANL